MEPALQLVLVLVVLHVVEGALFVRRHAYVFVGRGSRFSLAGAGAIGNDRGGFLFLDPLLPSPVGHVVDLDPLTLGPGPVLDRPPQAVRRGSGPAASIPEPELQRAWAEGKAVRLPSRLLARTSSPAVARAIARDLASFAEASDAERSSAWSARVEASHDLDAIRARKAAFERATRGLAWIGPLTLVGLVVSLYAVFNLPWAFAHWPLLVLACAAMVAHLGVETWSAHRQLYPDRTGDRAMKVALLVFSPAAAARARAFVGRDLLDTFHPLAVARVLLDPPAFERMAGPLWRDLRFEVELEGLSEEARAGFAAARDRLRSAHRALIEGAGVKLAALEAPPEREGDDAQAYCPRCHAQYASASGACEECPGVPRRAFSSSVPDSGPVAVEA